MVVRSLKFAGCFGVLLLSGCVERTITVTSEPAGSLVFLNDEEVGRTPLTVPFTYYGTYDVRMEHDGYHPLWTKQSASPPWWEYPGPDLVAEMIPDVKTRQNWHFKLEPSPDPNVETLIDRAKQMRSTIKDPPDVRP